MDGGAQQSLGDFFREWAARWSELAQRYDDKAESLHAMAAERDPEERRAVDEIVESMRAQVARVRLVQGVAAAQALAYDAMIAEGGPTDDAAMAAYRERRAFNDSLLPRFEES